ncbi:MAG: glutamate--tRNA ligase [Desulfotignum sp.]
MKPVVTRFPPSPTGFLHIGGARTIEDTDEDRSTKESVDAILESLEWLGIDWDEGPYFQTQRKEIHDRHIEKLVEDGHAYYCACTPEEVNAMREQARAKGLKPMYNGRCRERALSNAPGTVVRLKTPDSGATVVQDIVKGDTAFQNTEIDDFIIRRSDGSAMYNLAVVVDDLTMGVTVIIRGDDHLINTPKQILIYQALGGDLPVFGHVPMVLGPDKARLSKRHGAMSVSEYREMGYLPDAVINYLVRLGWSHGDQEFFTRNELIEKFDLKHLGRSAGMFDISRMTALNAKHIQAKPAAELVPPLLPHLQTLGLEAADDLFTRQVVETLQPRSKTLKDMAAAARFYFVDAPEMDEKAAAKFLTPEVCDMLNQTADAIDALSEFTQPALEAIFKKIMADFDLGFGKIAQPLRVAVTGTTVSPGIFEMLLVLGKDRTVQRIRRAARTA